ncbi:MAG: phytanoyl-CoA dioxygenase family protein [Brevundimonas sp.]|uniref:phytanoyl-CoA dioxygenase family protein n=1 Tax=Brevundimonas sp. TaxID=1871086 RepID=UPI002AB9B2BF|nr:phytanoyl-CoA dioxygenase family protein [Brevundimonas sp.]MDZ4113105.1 phytanoyl-CoA dioxygenase family protein [Brevundimonas sp.]
MGAAGEDDLAGVSGRERFERDGALRFEGVLASAEIKRLRALADEQVRDRPGARLIGDLWLASFLSEGAPARVAINLTSPAARPVRAVMFDKSPAANWSVAWHQDRTVPVRERREVEGFGPWSLKDGVPHVAPPIDVLARMVTLRLHLDEIDADNAPLRVAVGSHRLGRVAAGDAAERARSMEQRVCLAGVGDIWAYRTPVLHGSDRASGDRRRRVLQVDYADFDLPGGLEWRGLAA